MSYDFVVLTPEAAGDSVESAMHAAQRLAALDPDGRATDPRVDAFHTDVASIIDALPDDEGWVSVWPLTPLAEGLFVPVPYPAADAALLTLLRLAARHGLVVADLSSESVDRPAPGIPVSVRGGDGTRLGALTEERLRDLVHDVGGEEPYLVLDAGDRFAQTYRESEGSWLLEHSDGSGHVGTSVTTADEVSDRLWRWLNDDADFGAGLTFSPV